MLQFILWILPPIVFFLFVWFMRTNVLEPKVIKSWYLMTFVMLIPIVGLCLTILLLILFFVGVFSGTIKFKKNTKFYKRWVKS
jgi:hypothetical protein